MAKGETADRWTVEGKPVEQELQRSEECLRLLIQSVKDYAIFSLDPGGRVASWNAGAEEIKGYHPEEIIGQHFSRFYPDEDLRRGKPERALAVAEAEGRYEEEGWRVRKDGSCFWANVVITRLDDDQGRLRGFAKVVRDVSERRQAERELRKSEERLRMLVGSVRDAGIFSLDPGGGVASWNAGAEEIKGYHAEEIIGQHFSRFYPDEDLRRGKPERALAVAEAEGRYEEEGWRVRKDGSCFWANVVITRLDDDQGRLRGFAKVVRDVSERRRLELELAHQGLHDGLTGLANRTLFLDRVGVALARSRRHESGVAVLFLDLDRFKVVNDSLGHAAGDRLLVQVASRITDVVRPADSVGRFGGDEFTVLCEEVGAEQAVAIAERIAEAVERPVIVAGREIVVSASIGIVLATAGETAEALVRDAHAAMYRAKECGRGRYEVFDERMRVWAVDRLNLELRLRRAIEEDGFHVVYQPQVSLRTGEILGVEALVRWDQERYGSLGPAQFIPVAEETGLIVPLGAFVLAEACRQATRWRSAYPNRSALRVAVNLSLAQLADRDFVRLVETILDETRIDPATLCLEITETVLMSDSPSVTTALTALSDLGVRLAIDDFGTGYSSLGYIRRFPVSSLKVDALFVQGLGRRKDDAAIVAAVAGMGKALGLGVVAEGVESPDQCKELQALGCECAQGYYFGRPRPADAIDALLCDAGGG